MTISSRPAGDPPQFATDDTFSSGTFVGLPNKVRPSDGQLQQGHIPGERPAAEHANYIEHDILARLAHYDLLELTFPEPAPDTGLIDSGAGVATPGNTAGEIAKAAIAYAPCEKLVFANNGDTLFESYDGGYTWQIAVTVATITWAGVAAGVESTGAIYTGPAVRFVSEGDGNVWNPASVAPTGVSSLEMMVFDPYSSKYLIGGTRAFSGGVAGVWTYDETGSDGDADAMAAGTQHPASPQADPISYIAAGPTYNLYASYSGGLHSRLWRAAKADATATTMSPPGSHPTNEVRDLLWDPIHEWFLYISAVGNIWISPTGADGTWLHRVTDLGGATGGIPNNAEFLPRSACVRGSVITAMITGAGPGTQSFLGVSRDGGINWQWLPDPVARHTATSTADGSRCRLVGNRFAVLGYKGTGVVGAAYGFRCGPL